LKGSLQQYNQNTWHYVVRLAPVLKDGKKVYPQKKYTIKAADRDDAESRALEILKKLKLNDFEVCEDPSLSEWLDRWLEDGKKEWAKGTYVWYEQKVRLHIKPKLGLTKLSKLKTRQIKELLVEKQEESPHLPNQIYRTLKAALQQAIYSDEVEYQSNIMDLIEPPEKPQVEHDTWSGRQIQIFLNYVKKKDFLTYAFCAALFTTGMRFNECAGLTWDCIDYKNSIITLYRKMELRQVEGKPEFGKLKNKKPKRILKVPTELMRIIKIIGRLQKWNKAKFGEAYNDYNLVFTVQNGGRIDIDNFRRRRFEPIIDEFNLDLAKKKLEEHLPRIRLHDMRHSVATYLLDSGERLENVQDILGHSTPVITKQIYIHDNAERQKTAVKKTSRLLKTL
jgi:integrase